MKAIINRHLFSQNSIDSGSITMHSTVVHKFSEPGEYLGKVIRGKDIVGQFRIIVGKRQDAAASQQKSPASPLSPTQVHVDLRQLEAPTARRPESSQMSANRFTIGADGYAVFKVSTGAGGYAVEVYKAGEKEGAKVFDSRELNGDDLLYALLLRPGTYSVVNAVTNARAELVVAYPEKGMPRNLEPVRIECGNSFAPEKINTKPMQGIVFSFKAPSRIKIDLVRPEDRADVAAVKDKARQTQSMSANAKPSGKKILRRIRITPRSASL
ncbi:MAG: hypothetical protein ACREAY_04745 [Nitrososphaera sp.]|uniref:hypothetical protein n=1 Tax=Nitrososphaera sp. TaxID=1971748 RepID=UPI003D6EC037